MYEILYAQSVEKELRSLQKKDLTKIIAKIQSLATAPIPQNAAKLKGADKAYRIRLGNYHIVYTVDDGKLTVLIIRVAHRREVYKNL